MRIRRFTALLVFIFCIAVCSACARMPLKSDQWSIPASGTICVAPFTQPVSTSDLITGALPEKQGRVPADMLPVLDRNLRDVLTNETKCAYTWLSAYQTSKDMTHFHTSKQPQALPRWIEYGKKSGERFLLIPQVLNWHEREGSNAGVTNAAHVRVEFFLFNVQSGVLVGRSVYEEEQTGLVDNLLDVGSFIRRHGAWVTAELLAGDGMRKAVKDFGL